MSEFARTGEIKGVSDRKYDLLIKLFDNLAEKDQDAAREAGVYSKCAFYREKDIRFGLGHKEDRMFYWVFGKDQDSVNDIVKALTRGSNEYKGRN